MNDAWFRQLDPTEEGEFKKWARASYTPGDPINDLWHRSSGRVRPDQRGGG